MQRAVKSTLAILLCGLAAITSPASEQARAPATDQNIIQPVVYPFEALFAKKRGKVEADFIIDQLDRLVDVTIVKSDAPEFSEAVRAYAAATDFSKLVAGARKTQVGRENATFALRQVIEFDERTKGKFLASLSTPSPAALAILAELRQDPSGKKYGGANRLDHPLAVVSNSKPIFPRQLQETVKEGSAVVEFYVGNEGRVLLPRTVSATHPAFGYSACQSVATWRFTEPMRSGKPVVVRVRIPINYSLTPETKG